MSVLDPCKPCLRRGQTRESIRMGLCLYCLKKKCQTCPNPSAGNDLCSSCTEVAGDLRARVESDPMHFDADHDAWVKKLRAEGLLEARLLCMRGIELLFRGFTRACEVTLNTAEKIKE